MEEPQIKQSRLALRLQGCDPKDDLGSKFSSVYLSYTYTTKKSLSESLNLSREGFKTFRVVLDENSIHEMNFPIESVNRLQSDC